MSDTEVLEAELTSDGFIEPIEVPEGIVNLVEYRNRRSALAEESPMANRPGLDQSWVLSVALHRERHSPDIVDHLVGLGIRPESIHTPAQYGLATAR